MKLPKFSPEERERISMRFEDDALYILTRYTYLPLAGKVNPAALSPEEVFAMLAEMLDDVMECPEKAALQAGTMWDDFLFELRSSHTSPADEDTLELIPLTILTLMGVCGSFIPYISCSTRSANYFGALFEHSHSQANEVMELALKATEKIGEARICEYMMRYASDDASPLTDEIYNVLHPNETNEKKEIPVRFRLRKNQKTNFAKIIYAMYDLNMFVDDMGNPASNIQDLMDAFGLLLGEDFKNLPQIINAAKNTNYTKIFDDLKKQGTKRCD